MTVPMLLNEIIMQGHRADASRGLSRASVAMQYQPRKGDALLFYSMHPNGTFDKHALHGGCPGGTGHTKRVATKWIRDKCSFGAC